MSKQDGGPAFPTMTDQGYATGGITVRDWFAGKALTGWLSSPVGPEGEAAKMPSIAAGDCYKYADAMLAERNKP